MTINFALSLSFEGIELLQRVQSGWRRIDRVDLASGTLNTDLTELRQKAIALTTGAMTTKLIIPADQIKFTAIDSTQTTQDDIDAVLTDATPYGLDELVVDYERSGGRTHIAAVARETLKEAEAFAAAHGFNPVAFVAVPEPFTFQKEVFFGQTSIMPKILGATAEVTRDDRPVFLVGTRLKSRSLVMDDAEDVDIEDFFDPTELPETEVAPPAPAASSAPEPTVWIDAIPSEVWPQPAPSEPPIADLPAPVLAEPPLFDLVIAEFHPRTIKHEAPALMAVTHDVAAQAPKLGVAAVRTTAPVVAPVTKRPIAIAASIAAFVAVGAIAWWQFASSDGPNATSTPVEVADPLSPEAGPSIPEFAATSFGASNTQGIALPDIAPTQAPSTTFTDPGTILAGTPDALPPAPELPPSPPVEVASDDSAPRVSGRVPSPAQADLAYAQTGVWQRSPRLLDTPSGAIAFGFTRPAMQPAPERLVIPEVPAPAALQDFSFSAPVNPPPADAVFARDENGFILATPEGTLTPSGAVVFAGLPELTITLRPELSQGELDRMALLAPAPEGVVIIAGPPAIVPPLRPANAEIAQAPETPQTPAPPLGGVGLAGLELQSSGAIALDTAVVESRAAADLRPRLRPGDLAPAAIDSDRPEIIDILTEIAAEDATLRFDTSTTLAVRASQRPALRPSGFRTLVAAVTPPQAPAPSAPSAPSAPVAAAAPVPPQNYAPVPGGVARAATQEDVIRLRDINLIGVYGRPNARRALVRLGNGSYVRVEVGSELDGGQVTAIGDEALNYVKRGRTYAIQMPAS
jgi:hypothetical protein